MWQLYDLFNWSFNFALPSPVQGKYEIVKLLLKHGADASKKNRDGHTPLDLVKEGDQVRGGVYKILTPLLRRKTVKHHGSDSGRFCFCERSLAVFRIYNLFFGGSDSRIRTSDIRILLFSSVGLKKNVNVSGLICLLLTASTFCICLQSWQVAWCDNTATVIKVFLNFFTVYMEGSGSGSIQNTGSRSPRPKI